MVLIFIYEVINGSDWSKLALNFDDTAKLKRWELNNYSEPLPIPEPFPRFSTFFLRPIISKITDSQIDHPLQGNIDIIGCVLAYCHPKDFLFLASVSKSWKLVWRVSGRSTWTSVFVAVMTRGRTEQILDQRSFHRAAAFQGGIFRVAAHSGNLGGLQAASEKLSLGWTSPGVMEGVTDVAAAGGHLEILRWARAQGCGLSPRVCRYAVQGGHLNTLKWTWKEGYPLDQDTCALAAENGHLEVLKWAREKGCSWDERTCSGAACGGHLEVLMWARSQGCRWSKETCELAAMQGNIAILMWARREGCPWDARTCSFAGLGGHLDTLRWMKAQKCEWDEDTCACAAQGGHLEILRWARSQGCPWNAKNCATIAARRRHPEVVEWITQQV